jgi:nucleoprotein TPR
MSSTADETHSSDDAETKLSELRSVVSYLRKEKEIVDLQLQIAKTENMRLASRAEQLSADLDAEKQKLSQASPCTSTIRLITKTYY